MPRSRSLAELIQQNRSIQASPDSTGEGIISAPEARAQGGGGSDATIEAGTAAGVGSGAGEGGSKVGGALLGGLLKMFMGCWVAAEYYPRGSDDWLRCRNWVLHHPWLARLYYKHGERFASFLHSHPLAHRLFQPVVEMANRRGRM